MNLRLFAVAGVVLAGAAGLQAVQIGGGLAALLAAPAAAAEPEAGDDAVGDDHAAETEAAAAPLPAPEGEPASGPSFQEQIGASADEYRILISLQQRRQELEAWEAEIDTRAQIVESAEARVQERLAELHTVRDEVRNLLGMLNEQEETRIASLVSTFEKMDAADGARILAGMDNDTAILVLSRMKAQNLADVMGEMETPDAMRITSLLAARADTTDVVGDIGEIGGDDDPAPAGDDAVSATGLPADTAEAAGGEVSSGT